jgi:MoxR-like ATPase
MDMTMEELRDSLDQHGYITDDEITVAVFLALKLQKPILLEGAPGVGKTEIAKVLSDIFKTELIRLQCYEGLDETKALYEWNYQKQLIQIQLTKDQNSCQKDLFDPDFLLERPLLKAIKADQSPVLLIDEIDKTDEEFEAFLFEVLSDFQVSIPELGTIKAKQIPIVVLTSNAERELSDGLKRRCVYLYIDYPKVDKELRIIRTRVPAASERLSQEIARAVEYLRSHLDLKKKPAISETLDWARALVALDSDQLEPELVNQTLSIIFKNKEDMDIFKEQVGAKALVQLVSE